MPEQQSATTTAARPVTVRVCGQVHRDLELFACVQGTNIAQQAQQAVSLYIIQRILSDELDGQVTAAKKRFGTDADMVRSSFSSHSPSEPQANICGGPLPMRLDSLQASRLVALSLVDDDTVADQLRHAFDSYIESQSGDERLIRARAHLAQEDFNRAKLFANTQAQLEPHGMFRKLVPAETRSIRTRHYPDMEIHDF